MTSIAASRRRVLLAAAAALVLLLLAGRFLVRAGAPVAPLPTAAARPATTPRAALVVDVTGAVRRPGLYRLRQGDRVADALAHAGGATGKAALDLVNLAAPLVDGEQVVVPTGGAVGAPGAAPATSASSSGPVHLSTATVEQLDALPGIGPVTAQKIVDYRTRHGAFRSVDELDAIPGIGPARIEQLQGLVAP